MRVKGLFDGASLDTCCLIFTHLVLVSYGSVMPMKKEVPSITEFHSATKVLPLGHTARFTCNVGGTPEPMVEWLHNGRSLKRESTNNQAEAWVERGFLFVRGVRSGVNTVCCMATNSAGTANHTAELLVFGKIWIQGEMFVVPVFIIIIIIFTLLLIYLYNCC